MDDETARRTKRIETKVTLLCNHLGIDSGGNQPTYNAEQRTVYVPTPNATLGDILRSIPSNTAPGRIDICKGNEQLISLNW